MNKCIGDKALSEKPRSSAFQIAELVDVGIGVAA